MRSALVAAVCLTAAGNATASAWGVGAFQNDSAVDWILDLNGDPTGSVLRTTLLDIPPRGDIFILNCELAMAAAQVVGARRSGSADGLPAKVVAWLEVAKPTLTPEILSAARAAVQVCSREDRSQLKRAWHETKQYSLWVTEVEALVGRLQ